MNKKGFTLIELLAVIVVLSIILVIAVPRVLNVIEEADKEAFRITGENLIKGAKDRQVIETTGPLEEKTYTITNGEFVGEKIPISGKVPNNGTIAVDEEGNVYLEIRNEKYCAKKDFNSKQIIVTTDIENCRIELPLTNDCFEIANISETEVEITGYNSDCPLDVIIPSEISGKTVVGIGNHAFSDVPAHGVYQLNSNNLLAYNNDIVIKNTTEKYREISLSGPNYRKQIKSVIIPNTVKYIRSFAFSWNQLTSVDIPSSVTSIGNWVFSDNQLTNIVIPSSVTSIGDSAFWNNFITSVLIPNSVTSIGEGAFGYNQLTSVDIPSSVTSIGVAAFNNNQLPDNQAFIYKRNSDGSEDKTTIVSYGGAKRDNVSIPNSVTSIGSSVFSNNQLTSITIPNSVTTIGEGAFYLNQLTSVDIPSSVTSIGDEAFSDNHLTSVIIPSSVTLPSSSISPSFYTSYVTNNNKLGGTYTSTSQDGVWTKQ